MLAGFDTYEEGQAVREILRVNWVAVEAAKMLCVDEAPGPGASIRVPRRDVEAAIRRAILSERTEAAAQEEPVSGTGKSSPSRSTETDH